MRIAYITSTFPGYKGCGIGIYAGVLAPHLAATGIELHILTSDLPEIEAPADDPMVASPRKPTDFVVHKSMHSWQVDELWKVSRFIEQVRPDILHLNHPTRIAAARPKLLVNLLPLWNRMTHKIPFVTTLHEFSTVSTLGKIKLWPLIQLSDVILATTRRSKRALEAWPYVRRLPPDWIEVVEVGAIIRPSILDEPVPDRSLLRQRWGLQDTDRVVGFAGFLTYPKGFHHLIEVVAPLMREDPDLKVLALSSWNFTSEEYRQKLTRRIEELGLSTRFIFTGFLENDELWHHLGAVDVCSFPCESPIEIRSSGPLRLALLRGVPVQTYANSLDYDEFGCLHGRNIWLTPFPNLDQFRLDLKALLDNPGQRQSLSQGTLAMHSELRTDAIAGAYRRVYERLLSR